MPMRTGSSSARCASIAASTAARAEANAAYAPSPVCLNSQPPRASIAARTTSSCAANATCIASGSSSHLRVDPSISVKRNVTVPLGALALIATMSRFRHLAYSLPPPHLIHPHRLLEPLRHELPAVREQEPLPAAQPAHRVCHQNLPSLRLRRDAGGE